MSFLFLEFDALKRLGIDDPVLYIKNHYGNSDVILLKSCCIGYSIQMQITAAIEEAKTSHSWVDILVCLCVRVCVVFVKNLYAIFSHYYLHHVSLLMPRCSWESVPQEIFSNMVALPPVGSSCTLACPCSPT